MKIYDGLSLLDWNSNAEKFSPIKRSNFRLTRPPIEISVPMLDNLMMEEKKNTWKKTEKQTERRINYFYAS